MTRPDREHVGLVLDLPGRADRPKERVPPGDRPHAIVTKSIGQAA